MTFKYGRQADSTRGALTVEKRCKWKLIPRYSKKFASKCTLYSEVKICAITVAKVGDDVQLHEVCGAATLFLVLLVGLCGRGSVLFVTECRPVTSRQMVLRLRWQVCLRHLCGHQHEDDGQRTACVHGEDEEGDYHNGSYMDGGDGDDGDRNGVHGDCDGDRCDSLKWS